MGKSGPPSRRPATRPKKSPAGSTRLNEMPMQCKGCMGIDLQFEMSAFKSKLGWNSTREAPLEDWHLVTQSQNLFDSSIGKVRHCTRAPGARDQSASLLYGHHLG